MRARVLRGCRAEDRDLVEGEIVLVEDLGELASRLLLSSGAIELVVEEATAEPGRKRGEKR